MISRGQMICLAVLLLIDAVAGATAVKMLPESVPVHWNFSGQVDRYGSPWEFMLLGPPVTLLVIGALLGVLAIPSVRSALARSGAIYGRLAIAIVGAMVAIHLVAMVQMVRALGGGDAGAETSAALPTHILSAVFAVIGVLLAVMGNWLGKLRRNAVIGIRTPWTLASDAVWERTHRVGGRWMVAHGIAVAGAAIFLPFWAAPDRANGRAAGPVHLEPSSILALAFTLACPGRKRRRSRDFAGESQMFCLVVLVLLDVAAAFVVVWECSQMGWPGT